jgi:hypothetical protein
MCLHKERRQEALSSDLPASSGISARSDLNRVFQSTISIPTDAKSEAYRTTD